MILQSLRQELAYPRTSVQLCILGIAGGVCAASLIILFRLAIEYIQIYAYGGIASYNKANPITLFLLPIFAVIGMLLLATLTRYKQYRMGIPFVIHRFKRFYGHIPFKTTINQFIGGVLALSSGFVVGREGPSVHIAAAGSHFIGSWLRLPFNSLRILTGCGIAAGIAAAFNTPFAAVIFVMEVVLREYKVYLFVPVMLAAACGTMLSRAVFGNESELSFLNFQTLEPSLLLYLLVFGFCMGLIGSAFNVQLMWILRRFRKVNMLYRFSLAALITASVGYFIPDALGAEFINVQNMFNEHPSIAYLCMLFVLKFMLATIALGLGIPGGIIGAVMTIGMLAGVILLQPLNGLDKTSDLTATFALLGLAGMLASVLHAPMAALSAAMELSSSPEAVMPCIIVIVSAYVTGKQLCKNQSIFIQQLEFQELKYTSSSIRDVLQKTGVLAVMKRDFDIVKDASETLLYARLQASPETFLMNKIEANIDARFEQVELNVSLQENVHPTLSHVMLGVSHQATMAEVHEILHKQRQGAVYIFESDEHKPIGIITWNMLHSYLFREQH